VRWFLFLIVTVAIIFNLDGQNVFAQDGFAPPSPPPPGTFVSDDEDAADLEDREEEEDPASADAAQTPVRPRFGGGSPPAQNVRSTRGDNANPAFDTIKQRKPRPRTTKATANSTTPGTDIPLSQAQAEDITNENYPELIEAFDYPNADIADVVKAISELTGKNFIIDPNIRGKITILAPSQITVAEAYKAFLAALAMNGFTVVPYGSFLKIKTVAEAKRDSINTYSGDYSPHSDQLITRIIHLKHISAEEVTRNLRILASNKGDMSPYPPTNSLIVTDFGSNIQRIMSILSQLDVAGFEEQLSVIPIKHAKAKDIAELIEQIINNESSKPSTARGGRRSSFSSRISRFSSGTGSSSGAAFSQVIPDDRTNTIIVVGNNQGIDKIRSLVRRLDYPLNPEDAGGVYVYYMKHADAKLIADILNGVAKDAQATNKDDKDAPPVTRARNVELPDGTSETFFGGDVKITADETINSLVITANRQDYESVKSLLTKLDIPRSQVNVEVIIMEISSGGNRSWGMSTYHFNDTGDPKSNGIARTGFNGGNLTSAINKNFENDNFILGFGAGKTITMEVGGTELEIPNLLSFISFIESVSDANIMSQPSITVLDNVEAEIEVGETVPVSATQTVTNGVSQIAPTLVPATLKLLIKPRISPGSNSVKLALTQTIKQLTDTPIKAKNLADNTATTSERNIKTEIVVNNKDTAVIGGLMKEEETFTERKVPLLGDIPVLGWLFKSKQVEKKKSNLVMFITPTIIRNPEDSRTIREEKLDDRIDFIKRNMGGRDPFGKQMDELANAKAEKSIESFGEEDSSTLDQLEEEFSEESDEL